MSVDITSLQINVKSEGIKEASTALGGLSTSSGNAEKRVTSLVAAMERLNTINKTSSLAADAFITKMREQAALMQGMSVSSRGAATGAQQLASAMALLAASMNTLNSNVNTATAAQRRHNEGMREGNALARGLAGGFGALWVTYSAFTGMAVGVAIAATLKGVITVGKDVEQTLESLRVKGQETAESVNQIRAAVMDLGQGIYGPREVAKAFETMVLAGVSAKEATVGIADALNLATVGGTSIEKSAYTIVQVGTALGYSAENYSRIADVIAATAASSMSSVESLSEAFKSGSVVGKLYGVSLVDIGTSLAALSNLGIQGSAAGTSLKNFYKELAADTSKVKETLKGMKLVPEDFKDADGNYKSILEVVGKLAEGLGNLTEAEGRKALANLANERGMKTIVELYDLYKKKLEDTTQSGVDHVRMLEEMRKKIAEAYGFAAIGAAQMALTVEGQFKSVGNTIQTQFLKAFQSVSPQLIDISTRLKAAFNSPEFITGVQSLATGVANFSLTLIENLPLIADLVKTLIAAKAFMFVVELFTSISVALRAVGVAGFFANAGLGPLAIALMAAGAAYAYFTSEREKSLTSPEQKNALKYSEDLTKSLDEEATRLEKQIQLMKDGKKARDAETESMYAQQLAAAKGRRDSIIGEASSKLIAANSAIAPTRGGFVPIALKENLKEAQKYYTDISSLAQANYDKEEAAVARVMARAKEKEELRLAQEKEEKAALASRGTGTLTENSKGQAAAERDAFRAELLVLQGQIDNVRRNLQWEEEALGSKYRQGKIGEIALIKQVEEAEKKAAATTIALLEKKYSLASGKENKQAVKQEIDNARIAQVNITEEAERKATNRTAEYYAELDERISKSAADGFKAKGDFANAYIEEYKSKNTILMNQLKSDIQSETDADNRAKLIKLQNIEEIKYFSGLAAAENKTAVNDFNVLAESTSNALKGIQTATEGMGISEMFDAASAASATLAANMDALREKQSAITGSKEANEAEASMIRLAETQRKLWAGVGESISQSLGDAFGSAGKAAGNMLLVAVKAGQTEERLASNKAKALKNIEQLQGAGIDRAAMIGKVEIEYANKSRSANLKMYGDMAGAAKGFFNEKSTGYKVMEGAEKAFRLLEMAGMAQSVYTTITTEAAKNTAKVPGVFMTFLEMLGPWGMAAAGVAIAAVLGGAFGGGGGGGIAAAQNAQKKRIETQGTGTVLGDNSAKSESISKSLELIAKYSFEDLEYSNKMLTAMQNLAASLTGVSKGLVLTQGLMAGTNFGTIEGSTAGFGGSVPIVGKLLSSIFGGGTTSTITGSGIKLDGSVGQLADKQGSFQQYEEIAKKKKGGWFSSDKSWTVTNFKPLEDDIVNSFARTFSSVRDGLLSVGTGIGLSADTLAEQINAIPIKMTAELRGLKGKELEEAVTAIFSAQIDNIAAQALGIVAPFAKMGEGLFETAVRVADTFRVIDLQLQAVGMTFGSVGIESLNARMGLVDLLGGLEEFTSKTNFFKENFLTEAEQLVPVAKAVADEMLRLGHSSITTIDGFKELVLAQNLSTQAGQEVYSSLMNVAPAFKKVADAATNSAEQMQQAANQLLLENVDSAMAVLQASVGREKDAAQAAYDAQIAIINAQKSSAEEVFNNTKTALTETLNAATASNTAFKALASSLKSTLDGMYLVTQQAMRRQSAQEMIAAALDVARSTGVLPTAESLSEALKTVSQPSENLFATFEDYATDSGVTAGQIADLNDITNKAVKKTDSALEVAKAQLVTLETNHKTLMQLLTEAEKSAKENYDKQISKLDLILSNAQLQLDAANGTLVAIASLSSAMSALSTSITLLAAAKGTTQDLVNNGGGSASGGAISMGGSVADLYQQALGRAPDAGGLAFWTEKFGSSVDSKEAADFIKGATAELTAKQNGTWAAWLEANGGSASLINGSHANGLDNVPFDGYTAKLHRGEMVLPATSAKAVREDASNKEILEVLQKLCEENSAENRSMASNLTTLRKLFERLSPDGQSLQTTPVTA